MLPAFAATLDFLFGSRNVSGWKGETINMETERLRIRRFQKGDANALYRLLSDEAVMRFLEPPFSWEQTVRFLNTYALVDSPAILAVEDRSSQFVGYVIYHPYEMDAYEIGWVLCREDWHKGYAQELTRALIEDARTKTRNLILECVPEQIATRVIAQRNGFVWEGNRDGCDIYRLRLENIEK